MNAVSFETKDAGGIKLSRVVELTIVDGKVTDSKPVTAFDIPAITISQAEQIATAHLLAALGVKNEITTDASSVGREEPAKLDEHSADGSASKDSARTKRKP